MKYTPLFLFGLFALTLTAPRPATAQPSTPTSCFLPADTVSFSVSGAANSFVQVTFNTLAPCHSISNGSYAGWCIDFDITIFEDAYSGRLYRGGNTNAPQQYRALPWNKINHVLNHKLGTPDDVQNAIWSLLGQPTLPPLTPAFITMTNTAHQTGSTYTPSTNDISAILLDPVQPVQPLIIEAVCIPRPPPTIWLTVPRPISNGDVMLSLNTTADCSYMVECSTNLLDWTPLMTAHTPNGNCLITDTNSPVFNHRFYRARWE